MATTKLIFTAKGKKPLWSNSFLFWHQNIKADRHHYSGQWLKKWNLVDYIKGCSLLQKELKYVCARSDRQHIIVDSWYIHCIFNFHKRVCHICSTVGCSRLVSGVNIGVIMKTKLDWINYYNNQQSIKLTKKYHCSATV